MSQECMNLNQIKSNQECMNLLLLLLLLMLRSCLETNQSACVTKMFNL